MVEVCKLQVAFFQTTLPSRIYITLSQNDCTSALLCDTNIMDIFFSAFILFKSSTMLFCVIVSLSGPILGREALGWFVDMAAIGASIGYFFTAAATLVTIKRFGDKKPFLNTRLRCPEEAFSFP